MTIFKQVKDVPKRILAQIDENIEKAEFDDRRIGGTKSNPVVADFVILNDATHRAIISIGRGRKFITSITKDADNIRVKYRFENHHRSRGWTLRTDLTFFDENGKPIGSDSYKRGLDEKDFRSYRRHEKTRQVDGIGDEAIGVLVVCYRDPSQKVKKAIQGALDEIKDEVIDELMEGIKDALSSSDTDDDRSEDEAGNVDATAD